MGGGGSFAPATMKKSFTIFHIHDLIATTNKGGIDD